jgi:hypothetical protein
MPSWADVTGAPRERFAQQQQALGSTRLVPSWDGVTDGMLLDHEPCSDRCRGMDLFAPAVNVGQLQQSHRMQQV